MALSQSVRLEHLLTKEYPEFAPKTGSHIFGISYERRDKGLFYDSIGPVGCDAKVYLFWSPKLC